MLRGMRALLDLNRFPDPIVVSMVNLSGSGSAAAATLPGDRNRAMPNDQVADLFFGADADDFIRSDAGISAYDPMDFVEVEPA